MNTSDFIDSGACFAGEVSPRFLNVSTGEVVEWPRRHNAISRAATTVIAATLGGDESMIPNRIGIVYGAQETPNFSEISRDQDWDALKTELESKRADVQVSPFSYTPSLSSVTRSDGAVGSGVTFHSHSDDVTKGAFGTADSTIFTTGEYIYQAVLLNVRDGRNPIIVARASLKGGSEYYTKPKNFEVAIDWTIKFF